MKMVKNELIAKESGDAVAALIKLAQIEIFRSQGGEPREPCEPRACEARDSIPPFEAKSPEPFACELRIDYLVPAESLKTSMIKKRKELKDWLKNCV